MAKEAQKMKYALACGRIFQEKIRIFLPIVIFWFDFTVRRGKAFAV